MDYDKIIKYKNDDETLLGVYNLSLYNPKIKDSLNYHLNRYVDGYYYFMKDWVNLNNPSSPYQGYRFEISGDKIIYLFEKVFSKYGTKHIGRVHIYTLKKNGTWVIGCCIWKITNYQQMVTTHKETI